MRRSDVNEDNGRNSIVSERLQARADRRTSGSGRSGRRHHHVLPSDGRNNLEQTLVDPRLSVQVPFALPGISVRVAMAIRLRALSREELNLQESIQSAASRSYFGG
jgi:hypothetical protein